MSHVVVTGCSGYIGSVLCKMLKEQGHTITGVDLVPPRLSYVDNYIEGCISSKQFAQAVKDVEIMFHMAADVEVGLSAVRPEIFYYNNVGNTAHMLKNLVDVGWRGHIVFSSSAAVYGEPHDIADIDTPTAPTNAYGDSKLICERMLNEISKLHDIKVTCFRYFNVAGAYQDVGDHLRSNHIIQKLCNAAYTRSTFQLFGDDYPTEDRSCVRDYIHVIDICRAHILVALLKKQKTKFEVFNLGSGVGYSNKEVIHAFQEFTGIEIKVKRADRRPGDPAMLVASSDDFMRATGFEYRKDTLQSMITTAWSYYKGKANHGI